ncbi:MAG: metallophosphoesterase [Clostridiales bacterium]|nr:metallophosphoesterase [Clostridiales bacterium]
MQTDLKALAEYIEKTIKHPASPDEVEKKEKCFYKWDETLPFSDIYSKTLEKRSDRDFVILNFADIQCHDGEMMSFVGDFAEETMDKLVMSERPDLITMTGDNAFDSLAYLRLIDFIESYNIPWAPVMGNADHTGLVSEFWADYRLHHAKNCLFDYGPEGMGDGNYFVNVTENGRIVHTLVFMDTHHEDEMKKGSYDHLYDSQIKWYEWVIKGVAEKERRVVPSSVFIHIPVPEVQAAWDGAHDKNGDLCPEYRSEPFCKMHEKNGAPLFNNGFFALCKKLGSTKNIIFGHDHKNCFSLPLEGITLTYAMKTGNGCYWERETNGGTVLRIDSDGNVKTDHHYIDPSETKIKRFQLEYYGVNLYEPNLNG